MFGADITYGFPGSGRDVTLAYEGFQGKDTDRVSADSTEEDIPNGTKVTYISDVGIFATIITAKGETETNYDAADLVFGQKLKVGERINLRPFIGMRYAYINIEDKGYYTGQNTPSAPETYQTNILKFHNTFNGIGPRFGSDAQINLGKGISVRGRLGLSALIGRPNIEQSSHYSRQDDISGTIFTYNNTTDVHTDTNTQIVPEIDGRLGLNYTQDFDSNFALGVEAGWQATSYISVFDDTPSDFTYDNGSGVPIVLHTSFDSNFGLQGPYARVQLDIA
ncbi:MAG: hypothetical protein K2Q33_01315 [Gammaproteobacteria bacterium]|nr:hypothetical protein [Gammaproteobacteria bacterium]